MNQSRETEFKVLITTSGIGSRLGEFTKFTNKSLVPIGDTPAITKIIESYPPGTKFVVTLGHYGDLVRQYLQLAHPDISVEFVEIENYDRAGSSLGLSMLSAREHLNCPFIFHASDTLVGNEEIHPPRTNWIAGFKGDDASQYTSFDGAGGKLIQTHSKGMDRFDFIHIGLIGIKEYEKFWNFLEALYLQNPADASLNDLRVVAKMLENGSEFKIFEYLRWSDVGSIRGLQKARSEGSHDLASLEKVDEAIFRVDNKIIKFFSNNEICEGRVKRALILSQSVPKVIASTRNFYSYEFVAGDVMSNHTDRESFEKLLHWASDRYWHAPFEAVDDSVFESTCRDFYFEKSKNRIAAFFAKSGFEDSEGKINGLEVPTADVMLRQLDARQEFIGKQGLMHGDFILDNLLQTGDSYTALDWRQDFGGLLGVGDIYYDLAKLNHSLTMNHEILNSAKFRLDINSAGVSIDILRYDSFVTCAAILKDFVQSQGLDYRRVEILTGIIWLNMSALHPHPLDLFLFHYGKFQLWRAIQQDLSEQG